MYTPHNKNKIIGEYHKAGKAEAEMAIEEAMKAKNNGRCFLGSRERQYF